MKGRSFILKVENGKEAMRAAWQAACEYLELGKPAQVTVAEWEPTRTKAQNRVMWSKLTDISEQLEWCVDGKMQYLSPEEWKQILSSGLKKEQKVAAGVNGGFVMLGYSTSTMKVKEMIELIEFILWFGAEHNIKWRLDDG